LVTDIVRTNGVCWKLGVVGILVNRNVNRFCIC
jgi:hypothetical protein